MGTYRYYIFEVREEDNNKLVLELLDLISKSGFIKNLNLSKELLKKDKDYRVWLEQVKEDLVNSVNPVEFRLGEKDVIPPKRLK